jgi:hypothetical protein
MGLVRRLAATVAAVSLLAVAAGTASATRNGWVSFSPAQTALTVGGGVAGFVGDTMRNAAEVGASWDVRVLFGTHSPIAFEAGYVGLYNKLQPLGTFALPNNAGGSAPAPYLVQNSFDADVRLNLFPWRVEPFVLAGIGYNFSRLYRRDQDPISAARFRSSDDQLLVPVGGGVSAYVGRHTTIDARFTYRFVFVNDMVIARPDARFDTWMVSARLGYYAF